MCYFRPEQIAQGDFYLRSDTNEKRIAKGI